MKDLIPTLKGFVKKDPAGDLIFVWCPYCKALHRHGYEDGDPRMKHHREAHCTNPDSPFKKTGYYIKAFSKKDLKGVN
jgi:hypothetical protein